MATATRSARDELFSKYEGRIEVNPALNRSLVSYQSNRNRPFYRWMKYKEGFSAALVEYLLGHLKLRRRVLFDPFAGSGAALFAAQELGLDAQGIELLPVGVTAISARVAAERLGAKRLRSAVREFESGRWRRHSAVTDAFPHLRITQGAFDAKTEEEINRFRAYLHRVEADDERLVLNFACMCVLESISYTRKDGQYLRWDGRAPRELRTREFDKGHIAEFPDAMLRQLKTMGDDVDEEGLFARKIRHDASMEIQQGSCLDLLPNIPARWFDVVVTSPPYCNRYDYTRTYALELAFLGIDEDRLRQLRQELLSCTVENRSKLDALRERYADDNAELFDRGLQSFESNSALQEVLSILDQKNVAGLLNNTNVPRMVHNYFLESAIVIQELGRVTKPGGWVVMVNDNVRYAGEEVPVDIILCEMAAAAGFRTEKIWALQRGKGNSSQQMGAHGRYELRKCAYLWQRVE